MCRCALCYNRARRLPSTRHGRIVPYRMRPCVHANMRNMATEQGGGGIKFAPPGGACAPMAGRRRLPPAALRPYSTCTRSILKRDFYLHFYFLSGAVLGLDLSWVCPGAVLGLSWGCPGSVLGLSWGCPGAALGLSLPVLGLS